MPYELNVRQDPVENFACTCRASPLQTMFSVSSGSTLLVSLPSRRVTRTGNSTSKYYSSRRKEGIVDAAVQEKKVEELASKAESVPNNFVRWSKFPDDVVVVPAYPTGLNRVSTSRVRCSHLFVCLFVCIGYYDDMLAFSFFFSIIIDFMHVCFQQ
jgi:hypothetical protein